MTDPIIDALKAEQAKLANEFFIRPPKSADVSYEYGLAMGTHRGLQRAIDRILKLYQDERQDPLDDL